MELTTKRFIHIHQHISLSNIPFQVSDTSVQLTNLIDTPYQI